MKMKTMVLIGVVSVVVLAVVAAVVGVSVSGSSGEASASASTDSGPFKAVVVLNVGTEKSGITGFLELSQDTPTSAVRVVGTINNLKPEGNHGFHVHESGDIRGNCTSTGGHYNPYMKTHGAPSDSERHIGDLGNIVADANGVAVVDITDDKLSLTGMYSIIGRAFVVHEKTDDLGKGGDAGSLQTGNAGGRVACGIIGVIVQKKN